MLLSASNLEQIVMKERLLDGHPHHARRRAPTTPPTSGRSAAASTRPALAPLPHRHPRPHQVRAPSTDDHSKPFTGADLGLYSITFTNDLDWDYRSLEDFHAFRIEAEKKSFRHFLEVFNPNVDPDLPPKKVASFLNDHIVRTLAGVTERARPLFLKIPYNSPEALEELVCYDPGLIVGVMGGSAGTTRDAFQLIHDVKKHGGRAALFGRKINLSEHPLAFIEFLRRIIDGEIGPEEAVKAYHAVLQHTGIRPIRHLQRDLQLTKTRMSYA